MARGRGSGRRTDYEWVNFGDILAGINPGSAAAFGVQALGFTLAGTVTRIRGRVGATLDTGAVNELGLLLCGLLVMTGDAVVTGSAPELSTNQVDEASWVWRGSLFLSSGQEAAVVTDALSNDLVVDSKAMRRVKPGEVLAMVFEAPAGLWADQAGTIDAVYDLHVLVGR